jgi:histidine ammonia-lyase
VTAAALAAETRGLARPASLDSMPTSDLEDLLGLGAVAARKARDAIDNVELILATELVAAVQGLDLLPTALTTKPLEAVRAAVRDFIPRLNEDRSPAPDVARAAALLRDGVVLRRAEEALGESLD